MSALHEAPLSAEVEGAPIPLRVDRFVVGDGPEQVTVTWQRTGWDVSDAMLGLHLYVSAVDINDSDEALGRARDLVVELRKISALRQQVAKLEMALLTQDTPF